MENFFKLKENGTSVRTEVVAGLTTFFAMAYIIMVNPDILSIAGMPWEQSFLLPLLLPLSAHWSWVCLQMSPTLRLLVWV